MTNLSDEQIRALVPDGVYRWTKDEWKAVTRPEWQGCDLDPSQVAERVLRCEECSGEGKLLLVMTGVEYDYDTGQYDADDFVTCPSCSPLRTLLLKLAGEGVEG